MNMEQTIRGLVLAAQGGDQQAIAQLYEQSSKKAYYLAKQLLKNEDLAQDILQDSYVKVFSNLHMLRQPENFQGWLDTVVINKSKDYLKKKKPVLFSQMSSEEEPDKEIDFEDDRSAFQPEAQVDYKETKRLVQAMIDSLPEEQRMAVVLRYLEDMPVKRIAQIMECSEGTVKSRLNYGRKAIKAQVLELEKKGTKLYCMPLIPFLYWMFRQQVLSTVAPAFAGVGAAAAAGAASGSAQAAGASSGAAGASSGAASGAGQAAVSGQATAAGGAAQGAASGAGAAAGGLGKGVAAAAVKTGAAAAGKGIAVKAAAVAAAVCIGGGAAAGGVYLARRSETAAVEEAEHAETMQRDNGEGLEESGGAAESELVSEKMQALSAVAEAARAGNQMQLAEVFCTYFDVLYEISVDDFQGEYVLFDGERLLPDVEGEGLLLRTRSRLVRHQGGAGSPETEETRYFLTGYYGNFTDGVPEGELLAFGSSRLISRTEPPVGMSICQGTYYGGEHQGEIRTWHWYREDHDWKVVTETSGDYIEPGDGYGYTGHFDISMDSDYWETFIYGPQGNEEQFWEYPDGGLPETLYFSLDIQEGMSEQGRDSSYYGVSDGTIYTEDVAWIKVTDETGNYGMSADELVENTIEEVIVWSSRYFNQGEGTVPFEGTSAREEEQGAQTETVEQTAEVSYEGAEDVVQLMEQYGQQTFQGRLSTQNMQETEEGYLMTVQLVVPLTFDEDPTEGKAVGDTVTFTVSDVTGQIAEFELEEDVISGGLQFDSCEFKFRYEPFEKDGKWRANGLNDIELAKEVYLGQILLRKDAQIEVFQNMDDYNQVNLSNVSAEDFAEAPEDCYWRCEDGELGLKEPEEVEETELVFNETGGAELVPTERTRLEYDYPTIRGAYTLVLDENGNISKVTQNWFP